MQREREDVQGRKCQHSHRVDGQMDRWTHTSTHLHSHTNAHAHTEAYTHALGCSTLTRNREVHGNIVASRDSRGTTIPFRTGAQTGWSLENSSPEIL